MEDVIVTDELIFGGEEEEEDGGGNASATDLCLWASLSFPRVFYTFVFFLSWVSGSCVAHTPPVNLVCATCSIP